MTRTTKPDDLANDPRWVAFNDHATPCKCCGRQFNGIFDLAFDHPDQWPHGNRAASGEETLRSGDDLLSADLCALGDDRFVKALIELPVQGSGTRFAFGVWCSLSADNFAAYVSAFGTEAEAELEPAFGWMCNALPLYDPELPLRTSVSFKGGNDRPAVIVSDDCETLARDQRDGITFDRLLDIYAAAGNDLRPHLEGPLH